MAVSVALNLREQTQVRGVLVRVRLEYLRSVVEAIAVRWSIEQGSNDTDRHTYPASSTATSPTARVSSDD